MRITTIFEAMATPSPSPSPVSSPRVLEKGETVDGDQAEGSVKRVGLLFEGLPPAYFSSTVPERHVQDWIEHGGLLQTRQDPEIWIFADLTFEKGHGDGVLPEEHCLRLGEPFSDDRKHDTVIFSSSWITVSSMIGRLLPMQDFVLYAGDGVPLAKIQVPPTTRTDIGCDSYPSFSSIQGIIVNDFSSMIVRHSTNIVERLPAPSFAKHEQNTGFETPPSRKDVTLLNTSVVVGDAKEARKSQHTWSNEVDPEDYALAVAWLGSTPKSPPVDSPVKKEQQQQQQQQHSDSSPTSVSPNKVDAQLTTTIDDSPMSLQRLLNNDDQSPPKSRKPLLESNFQGATSSSQFAGGSRVDVPSVINDNDKHHPPSMLDYDLSGLPHYGINEMNLVLPDLAPLSISPQQTSPIILPRKYFFVDRQTGQVASHAGGFGIGWMDPKIEEKLGSKGGCMVEGVEGGCVRTVERFRWIFQPKA